MKIVAYTLLAAGLSWTGTAKETAPVEEDKHPVSICLKNKNYRYEDLLNRDDLVRYLSIDESSLIVKNAPFHSENGWICFEWKSSREDMEIELLVEEIRLPDINRVILKGLRFARPSEPGPTGFQRFENLGDRAYWKWDRTHGLALLVDIGYARFSLDVKVAATPESDLEIGVYFARQVLARCIP